MKPRIPLTHFRRNLNVSIACLLTFSLFTMPFVPMAAAMGRSDRQVQKVARQKSSQTSSGQNYSAAPVPAPAPVPFVPIITATKTDALISDDGDGKADPGGTEKIEYTVNISNTGGGATDATAVVYSDTIDAHTTLVPGSVNTQPMADPDTYTASGNIAISIAAGSGVLANDRDPDTGNNTGLTVSQVQGVGANVGVATDTTATGRGGVKGSVTLNANGSFTYDPAPGFVGADTFNYTITDGTFTDTATVTINITQMVWWISNNAGGSNRGTFLNPFTSIASFNTANAGSGVAPDPKNGDFVVLRTGTGTYTETDGVNLRAQQKLIGNGIQFNTVFTADANSVAAYTTFAGAAGSAPNIVTTGGNGVDLSTDNTVRGLNVGNTPGFFKINGGAVGSPIINSVNLTGTGGALNVSTSGAFASNVVFGTLESTSSPASNLNLVNVTGQLGLTSPGTGFSGSAAAAAAVNVSGGTVSFTYNGNVSKTNAGSAVSISGGHSTGTIAFTTGTVSATLGDGLQFNNADGIYNFSGTNTLNGGDAGIDITNGSSGTFTFSASSTITSPTGTAFNVASSPLNPTVTYSGTVTQNTAGQRAVNIDGTTGGSVSIATVTAGSVAGGVSNTGININNATGNVTFTTLNLGTNATRMTAQAVTIAGGSAGATYALGTANIFTTGASATGIGASTVDGTINNTGGNVDAAGSPAINIAGPAGMTTLGMTWTKVAANGGPNGMILTNTNGSFAVNGDNTNTRNGTGGTIQNTTDDGVRLTNTNNVTLKAMNFTSTGTATGVIADNQSTTGDHAVEANTGSNLILSAITVTTPGGSGVLALDLSGTNKINLGSLFTAINSTQSHAVYFKNTTVSNTLFEINDTDFTSSTSAASTVFATNGSGAANVQFDIVNGCLFNNLSSQAVTITPGETAGATGTFTSNVKNSTFSNANAGAENNLAVLVANGATHVATVESNTFDNIAEDGTIANTSIIRTQNAGGKLTANVKSNTIQNIQYATGGRHVVGHVFEPPVGGFNASNFTNLTVDGNTVTNVTYLASTNREFAFIDYRADASGGNVTIKNNNWNMPSAGAQQAIELRFRQTNTSTVNVSVTNNTGTHNTSGVYLDIDSEDHANVNTTVTGNNFTNSQTASAGIDFATETATASMCVNVSGNTVPAATDGIRLTETAGTMTVTQASSAAVAAANGGTTVVVTGTPAFGSAACTLPSAPLVSQMSAPRKDSIVATTSAPAPKVTALAAVASQPSLFSRGMTAMANFASGVLSMIEPTAHASGNPEATEVAAPVTVTSQAISQVANQPLKVANQPVKVRSIDNRKAAKIVSNHARSSRALTPMFSGENVTVNIGTLRAGDSVTIKFQVTVNNPPNLTLLNPARVRNQGTVSGSNFSNVLTDDTAVGGASDPTDTPVDLFDTSTSLASDLNPSNFGDLVTFTATVTETPAQGAVDPTGTVDFIDTSNGNAVICNDVPLSTGSAQCQTSSLTAGTHNIRADYSGDGNFDPSQSNVVAQVVIACTSNPIVTSTADSGAGTLREAVANVCSGTTITFNLGAGPHTITLTTGELPVTKNVTIKNSGTPLTVSGNNASRVFNINAGKTVTIIGLTISGGSAASGAGVLNDGTLTIINSLLTGNTATSDGGGVGNTATATSLTLINTTVSGNNANGSGGGVVVLGGTMTSINSTISNNFADADNNSSGTGGGISAQAGTTTLKNTIVAGNFNEDGPSDAADDIGGTVDAASSFNLIGTGGAGGLTNGINSNQVGVANAGLGALADNGGLSRTHALLSTSLAIEAGSNANLPTDTFDLDGDLNTAETLPVDQRGVGFPRVADSADADLIQTVDIGAYESHPTIEDIPNQSTNEDTTKNVLFNLGDDTGSLISTVVATSSNTTLVPNANLSFTGSGGSRTLQIIPAANQSGTTTITVTVTATNGRTATDTFDLTVSAVNDPPSGTDNTVSTAEDTAYTFTAADFGFTDPNDAPPNTFLAVKITTLPGLGTLTNNNVPVNAGDFIPVANIAGGLLKFTPAPNGFGTPYTTFTFQVQDNGGGTDLDPTPNTMTINVTGVNDGPVNTVPGPQVTNEDVALVFSSGNANQISVADIDAGANPIKVTLTATNGTLTLSTTAGLAFITGDGTADATMMFTGTLTAVNTALNGMSFTGTANFSGAASLQIVSDDQGNTGTGGPLTDTDSVNITINAVNDPPSGTDNTVSTAEDTAYTFTAADFGFSDPNDTPPNTLLAVKITTLPGLGTLTNNNVPVNAGDFIPVANITGGLLKFTPAADGNGTPYTTFTFQVQDNGGGTDLDPTPNTMTINVTAVNDGPVNTVPGPQSTTEDTPKVFSAANLNQISVADVDAGANPVKITLTATNGTITLSTTAGLVFITGDGTADATMTFTGTLTAVNTAMNGMSFTPTLDFNGAASLQIVSDDQGNTGSGGPLTDNDTVNITVTAANDAPVVTTSGGNTSYTENAAATAIDTGLTVTDVDSANLVGATVAITSGFVGAQDTLGFTNQNGISGNYNSGTGVLTLTGSSSVANYQTALRSVTYANSSDNPTTSRTVTFIADDGSSTSTPATKGIAINAVNDAPVNVIPGPQGTNQNTPLTFSSGAGNQISVTDVDAGTNAVQVTLTATNGTLTLNGTSGLAFTVGDGTADATMTFTGTLANINTALNGMTFTPTAGFSGAATLTITTNDQGNSGSGGPQSDTDVINIQVSTNVTIQDAQVFEPQSGSTNMIFTVTLSAPAPAGGSSVQFTTVQLAPALNHATAGQDYTTTSGTVNFAAGEQVKTINVPVLSDNKKNEANETFEVQLSNPVNCTIADGTATGTIIENQTPGAVLISEIRTSGPAGAGDDFVEIYNNSDSPHVVNGTGGGYGLFKMGATCSATPVLIGLIPNGTTIPARGHYLFTGSAYSLANYGGAGAAAGDQTMSQDIESDRNVAIFSTGSLVAIGTANRLDAVGFGSNVGATCDLFREGNTLTPTNGTPLDHSYFRDECGKKGNPSTFGNCPTGGFTQDSNVNADDFIFADTNATATVMGQRLGAPGPQNLGSPRFTIDVVAFLLDSTKGAAGNPNRVRDTSPSAIGPNAANGTLSIRRRFQNNTGAPVTKLRIRVVDISTTFIAGGGVADLRLLTSGNTTDTVGDPATCSSSPGSPSTPCTITIFGTQLETPPAQPLGGGFNASATTTTVTLGSPLAPGASVNLQILLGVQTTGSFKFFFNVEALP